MDAGTNAGKINRPNVVDVQASESNVSQRPKIWHEEVEDDSKPVLETKRSINRNRGVATARNIPLIPRELSY